MRQTGETQLVILIDHHNHQTRGEVQIQRWDKRARTRRALRFLGLCWIVALCAVILPFVHFVAVPSLLLAGIVGAFVVGARESVVLGGESTCPHCHTHFQIVRQAERWPLSDQCEHCQMVVRIVREEAAVEASGAQKAAANH